MLRVVGVADPGPSAMELEASLRDLCLHEARCRRALGRLGSAFRRRSGHHRIGFATLADYARERLGLSGRELQSLAAVFSRLEELPAIRSAFERGEISWSQTRLLAAVARPTSEEDWLGRARGRTVRSLLGEIQAWSAGDGPRPADADLLDSSLDEESGRIEGEATARLRIRCPARVRLLWRRTVELGRRMLGTQSVVWKVAEAIAAEGSSAPPPREGDIGSAPSANGGPGVGVAGDEADAGREEPIALREAFPLVSREGSKPGVSGGVRGAGGAPVAGDGADTDRTRANLLAKDEEPLPEDLARSLAGLDAFDLDERMRLVTRSLQKIDARIGRALRSLIERRLHRSLGFGSFDRYARERLGMSPARARALVRIDREIEAVAGLGLVYRNGELSWVRVLTILPVVHGPFADRWISRAREVHVRRLADEVEWALALRDEVMARTGDSVGMTADIIEAMGWSECVSADAGGWIGVAPPPDGFRLDLAGAESGLRSGEDVDGSQPESCTDATGSISPSGPTEQDRLQTCARTAVEAGDWRRREIVDSEVTFFGPASVVALFRDTVAGFTPPNEPVWRGLEQLLLHATAEWERQPRHRDPVFARDGWRCTVPCCSARRDLHDHHRKYRSRGGGNQRWNRTTACALCRVRHNAHYADFRIMPRDYEWSANLSDGMGVIGLEESA